MSTPVIVPNIDPVLDTSYGMHPTEPRGKLPISRSMQMDDFTPLEVPPVLQETTPPTPDPATPPAPPASPAPAPTDPPAPPVPPVVEPPAPTTPVTVERVIDLNDGSGPQRFVGEGPDKVSALENLADKMTKAQENATRKIRQQNERLRAKPDRESAIKPVQFQPRQITEADITELKSLWETNLVECWRRIHEIFYGGVQPQAMVDGLNKTQSLTLRRDADEAAVEFLASHEDDYEASEKNSRKIHEFLLGCTRPIENDADKLTDCKRCGKRHEFPLPVTINNFEYAFQQLSAQGYNFAPAPVVPTPVPTPAPVVTAPPAPVVTPTPAPPAPTNLREIPPPPVTVSDRSGQRTDTPPPGMEGVDVSAINRLPLAEARARIVQALRSQPGPGR